MVASDLHELILDEGNWIVHKQVDEIGYLGTCFSAVAISK